MKLTSEQLKAVSEIAGNIAVAWFTAGIVSPFFFEKFGLGNFVLYLILGISMFGVFGVVSVYFAGRIQRRI